MTFAKRGELTQQGAQSQMEYFFKGYNRYRLDPNRYDTSLILSNRGKDDSPYRYQLSAQNDTLTLSPPCFEGCHFGFVKIK